MPGSIVICSASYVNTAELVIALLQQAERLLLGFSAVTVLADRGFPSATLLSWFERQSRWRYVMRLRANLALARPVGIAVSESWYLVSNLDPSLELVWLYDQRFYCEQLFHDQKSGIVQLEHSGLQGDAVSLAGERCRVNPHWKRGLSFARIGLHWLQQSMITAGRALLAWLPIPLQALEPCIPSRGVSRRKQQPWFLRVELPPPLQCTPAMAVA